MVSESYEIHKLAQAYKSSHFNYYNHINLVVLTRLSMVFAIEGVKMTKQTLNIDHGRPSQRLLTFLLKGSSNTPLRRLKCSFPEVHKVPRYVL